MVRMTAPLRKEKGEAIRMRQAGASYSQIKAKIPVSKSSLSLWLRDMPLPEERIRVLRDFSATRIERYRETRRKTREGRWAMVRSKARKDIGVLSNRELLLVGLFLYWGEGGKTKPGTTSLSNSDPAMIRFFMQWLESLSVPREKMKVHMHFYSDMDVHAELIYWSGVLGLPLSAFRKSYIKQSKRIDLTYFQRHIHGTCNLIYENRDVSEYVLQALECLRQRFAEKSAL